MEFLLYIIATANGATGAQLSIVGRSAALHFEVYFSMTYEYTCRHPGKFVEFAARVRDVCHQNKTMCILYVYVYISN